MTILSCFYFVSCISEVRPYILDMNKESSKFNILSLTGGGFRGLYTATILAELEKVVGKPIARCFDLICGTSIGGMIAMALGLEKPANEVAAVFEMQGAKIFAPSRNCLSGLCRAKYSNTSLAQVSGDLYGSHTLGDSRHRLLVPTVNYSTGRPQFFKTPHHRSLQSDHKRKMVDIALATSAAPVFFPVYESKETSSCYVDGGLVGNAPGMFGVHEAEHFCGQTIENLNLLSIGTMGGEFRLDSSKKLDKGIWDWGEKIFLLTISCQEKVTDYMLRHKLGDRYFLIDELPTREQEPNIRLDVADKAAIQTLKSMGEESAKRFIGKPEADIFLSYSASFYQPLFP